MKLFTYNICLFLIVILSACGIDRSYENYDLKSDADLILTDSTHPHGFGQSDCFNCHVQVNIHQVDRYGSTLVDTARILTETEGLSSCFMCHGKNGVK